MLVGVLIGALLSVACYETWSAWQARRLEERVSVSRTWPAARILGDVTVEVTTRCSHATLSYIVSIIPPRGSVPMSLWERTDQGKVSTDQIRKRLKSVRLQLADKEGAPAADYDLPIDDFVRIYSSIDDRPLILEARGVTTCDPHRYARADTLGLEGVKRPQPAAVGAAEP